MLQPLPATAQAIEHLATFGDDTSSDRLVTVATVVLEVVPASALSIWFVDEDLTLAMVDDQDAPGAPPMRSSLAMHVVARERLTAIVTVYSRRVHAFARRASWLERAVGAVPAASLLDHDLAFRSRRDAELAPAQVRGRQTVDMAIGHLMGHGLDLDEAERWLTSTSLDADLSPVELARLVLDGTRSVERREDGPPVRPGPIGERRDGRS